MFAYVLMYSSKKEGEHLSRRTLSPTKGGVSTFVARFFVDPRPRVSYGRRLLGLSDLVRRTLTGTPSVLRRLTTLTIEPKRLSSE